MPNLRARTSHLALSQLHQPFRRIEHDPPGDLIHRDDNRADEGNKHLPAARRCERELAPGGRLLEPSHGSERLAGRIFARPAFQFVAPVEIPWRSRKAIRGKAEDPAGKPVGLFAVPDPLEGEKKTSPLRPLRGKHQFTNPRARDPEKRHAGFERIRRISQAFDGDLARDTVRAPHEADGQRAGRAFFLLSRIRTPATTRPQSAKL